MSSARVAAPVRDLGAGCDEGQWERWLRARIEPGWRPGEWNPVTWLFTGDHTNPRTTLHSCAVRACVNEVISPGTLCHSCGKAWSQAGGDRGAFTAVYTPERRTSPGTGSLCGVRRGGVHCRQAAQYLGICGNHAGIWRRYRAAGGDPAMTQAEWATTLAEPYTDVPDCLVLGCDRPVAGIHGTLCSIHNRRWRQDRTRGAVQHRDIAGWAATQTPYLGAGRFSLAPLGVLARLEVLYSLQRRDTNGHPLSPRAMRDVVRGLCTQESLRGAEIEGTESPLGANAISTFTQMHRLILMAFDEFCGVKAIDKDVLDLQAVGLKGRTRTGQRVRHGLSDLTVISQPWLRSLLRSWIDGERPTTDDYTRMLRAVILASDALRCRPGGGDEMTALRLADMDAVVGHLNVSLREDGAPYTNKHRQLLFTKFCGLLDFGRRAGLLDELSGSFARHSCHRIAQFEENEDEIGKALPESVIDQLDQQVGSIGTGMTYGRMRPEDVHALFRAVYFVLRDTGRRPLEVASLRRDCLETIDGETSLVWNNRKGKRNKRRLPIDESTAEEIRAWHRRRDHVPSSARAHGYLFPAPTGEGAFAHLDPIKIASAIRAWVDALPALDTDAIGNDGEPVPFDRAKVFPYVFRHSYAQRHADAGTAVDVLKELMDHAEISTTMGYYTKARELHQMGEKPQVA